jgi:hypothetical protein
MIVSQDSGSPQVKSRGSASDNRCVPAAVDPRDESAAGKREAPESILNSALLEQALERANLQRAFKQVRQNQGAPGIDGMSVDELPDHLRNHWLEIRAQLVAGSYCPLLQQYGAAEFGGEVRDSIHRTAVYVTRSHGGVGGRGREASSYPD